ncbi:MAG: hypothetical protein K6T55_07665 [Syntrophobacterales bacterium]|nr:hypothetical protein [Syntrophobacterales bacterium]
MKARYLLIMVLAGALLGVAGIAWTGKPHFVGTVTATLLEDGSLRVCFKEAGLGNNQNIDYKVSATASATYQCVNNAGNCPQAANKRKVTGEVSAEATFNSGQNGQISQCLTIQGPPEVDPFCPGGQTETLAQVTYSGITITDQTNNITANARPATLSQTLFVCP